MASRRALRRKQCEGKRRHETRALAENALRHTGWGGFGEGRKGLEVFQCRNCGGWHVGHRKGLSMKSNGWRKAVARGRLRPRGIAS